MKALPRALVLAGGGARAAYEVGVLAAIAERAPSLEFPIVTGVSAGAINAVYLAAHPGSLATAARALRAQWSRLVVERVYRVRPGRVAARLALRGRYTVDAGPCHGVRRPADPVPRDPHRRRLLRRWQRASDRPAGSGHPPGCTGNRGGHAAKRSPAAPPAGARAAGGA